MKPPSLTAAAIAVALITVPAALVGLHQRETSPTAAYLRPAGCAVVRKHAPERIISDAPERCLVKIDKMLAHVVVTDGVQVSETELIALVKQK